MTTYKLPSWVSLEKKGFSKDEVIKSLGSSQPLSTSWLSTWKLKDEKSLLNMSYTNKNNDEFVAKSKAFVTAENKASKRKCVICKKNFLLPSYVCFVYKWNEAITKEKAYSSTMIACAYHFKCKGIFNNRKLSNKDDYEENDDFSESEFEDFTY